MKTTTIMVLTPITLEHLTPRETRVKCEHGGATTLMHDPISDDAEQRERDQQALARIGLRRILGEYAAIATTRKP